jgi:hypothetical protein
VRRSALTPEIRYNPTAGRYVGPGGRFVPAVQVRAALDRTLDTAQANVAGLSQQLRAGAISLADWQVGMAAELKSVHLASAALARGGWAQMAPADNGRAGRFLRDQYAYLRNFAQEIAAGKQRLDGTLPVRAAMYVQAGRRTYHLTERADKGRRGLTEERNLLGVADHCSECVAETGRGWVSLGDLVPIGERICRTNCRCMVDYR